MRRTSALSSKLQEEIFGGFPSIPSNSKKPELEDDDYLHDNSNCSDSESFSDESRKIRKKRNTYQKIPDDIRMQLLEAVQNGETLKAAAKRHKINYSSAKSILHTYRKEGRILKKSAQERSTKKRILSSNDFEQPQKPSKFSKKENVQPADDHRPGKPYQFVTLGEKLKSDENNGSMGVLKIDNYEHHYEENTEVKPLGEVSLSTNTIHKPEDSAKKGAHMSYDIDRMNQMEAIAAHNASKTMPKEDHLTVRPKMFDQFHMNYYDGNHYDTRPTQGYEAPEFTNYTHYPREMETYGDMISTWQNRSVQNDGQQHHHTTETHAVNEHTGGDMMGLPFMNFLETQRFFQRAAVRKASFVSYGGSSTGFRRKESFDLF